MSRQDSSKIMLKKPKVYSAMMSLSMSTLTAFSRLIVLLGPVFWKRSSFSW